jgi:hypothetical protein
MKEEGLLLKVEEGKPLGGSKEGEEGLRRSFAFPCAEKGFPLGGAKSGGTSSCKGGVSSLF